MHRTLMIEINIENLVFSKGFYKFEIREEKRADSIVEMITTSFDRYGRTKNFRTTEKIHLNRKILISNKNYQSSR